MAEHPEINAQERAGKAFPVSWDNAQEKHQLLWSNKVRDLQMEGR